MVMTWFSEFKLKENNIRLILSIFLIIFLIGFVSADFKFENTSGTELMRIFSSSGNLSLLGKINASDVCVGDICLGSLGESVSGDYVPYSGATKNVNLGLNNFTINTNIFHVDALSGRVGIGTVSPSYGKLHVSGDGNEGGIRVGDSSTTFRIYTNSSTNAAYLTRGGVDTQGIVIDSSGKIGIGTTSPQASLHVNYPTSGNVIFQAGTGDGSSDMNMKLGYNDYGWYWKYLGTGSGDNNELQLWSEGAGSTDQQVYGIKQSGKLTFYKELNLSNNKIVNLANGTSNYDAVTKIQLDAISSTVSGDYVPYTGATKAVNLGSQTFTTTGAISGATINTGQGATEVHLMNQNIRTTDNVSFNSLKIGNNQWISGIDSLGTGVINMFKINPNNEIDVGGTLNIGTLSLSEDSGLVTLVNMPVSSATSIGTPHGYVFGMDSENIMSVYSESDGSGGIQNKRVGIGIISPTATLDVNGSANIRGTLAMNNNKITGLANGTASYDAVTKIQLDAISTTVTGEYVPYTGATKTINLGTQNLVTTGNVIGNIAASNITSGTLAVARGGTGIASYTTGNYLYASGATTLAQRTPAEVRANINAVNKSGDTMSGALAMGTNKITGLGNGTAAQDAVTKSQLDAVSSTVSGDYVPYTGATKAINLGSQNLTTTGRIGIGIGTPLYNLDISGTFRAQSSQSSIKLDESGDVRIGI